MGLSDHHILDAADRGSVRGVGVLADCDSDSIVARTVAVRGRRFRDDRNRPSRRRVRPTAKPHAVAMERVGSLASGYSASRLSLALDRVSSLRPLRPEDH